MSTDNEEDDRDIAQQKRWRAESAIKNAIADPAFDELLRRTRVTRGDARRSAERSLAESADQTDDITPEVYQLLVVDAAPILLALASVDPAIRGAATGRIRALARRYSQLVQSQIAGFR